MRFDPDGDIPYQLNNLLNDGLELEDNLRGGVVQTTLDAGENEIQHGLGFVPVGYIVIFQDAAGTVHAVREREWTKEKFYLESSVASLKVRLFVL